MFYRLADFTWPDAPRGQLCRRLLTYSGWLAGGACGRGWRTDALGLALALALLSRPLVGSNFLLTGKAIDSVLAPQLAALARIGVVV